AMPYGSVPHAHLEAGSSVRTRARMSKRQQPLLPAPKRTGTQRSMELVAGLWRRGFPSTNAWRVRHLLPSIGTAAAFLAGYSTLDRVFGPSGANVFVLVPIVAAAWSFGLRGGLIGGVVVVGFAGALSWTSGVPLPAGAMQRVVAVVAV